MSSEDYKKMSLDECMALKTESMKVYVEDVISMKELDDIAEELPALVEFDDLPDDLKKALSSVKKDTAIRKIKEVEKYMEEKTEELLKRGENIQEKSVELPVELPGNDPFIVSRNRHKRCVII